jgi:hypothetical protein
VIEILIPEHSLEIVMKEQNPRVDFASARYSKRPTSGREALLIVSGTQPTSQQFLLRSWCICCIIRLP